jgi:hypothetical protein
MMDDENGRRSCYNFMSYANIANREKKLAKLLFENRKMTYFYAPSLLWF